MTPPRPLPPPNEVLAWSDRLEAERVCTRLSERQIRAHVERGLAPGEWLVALNLNHSIAELLGLLLYDPTPKDDMPADEPTGPAYVDALDIARELAQARGKALAMPSGQDRDATLDTLRQTEEMLQQHADRRPLELWGSDCTKCGNTCPDSMFCEQCASSEHTAPLFWRPPPAP